MTHLWIHRKDIPSRNTPYLRISSHKNSPLTIANVKLFPRSLSAFARQRTHHLSDIRKVPGSSRGGAIRREPADLADGPDEAEVTVKIKEQVVGPQEISSGDVLSDDVRLPTGVGSCVPSAMSLPIRDVPRKRLFSWHAWS